MASPPLLPVENFFSLKLCLAFLQKQLEVFSYINIEFEMRKFNNRFFNNTLKPIVNFDFFLFNPTPPFPYGIRNCQVKLPRFWYPTRKYYRFWVLPLPPLCSIRWKFCLPPSFPRNVLELRGISSSHSKSQGSVIFIFQPYSNPNYNFHE